MREETLVRVVLDLAVDSAAADAALVDATTCPSDEERRLFPLLHYRLATEPGPARQSIEPPGAVHDRLRRAWAESRALRVLALAQAAEVLASLRRQGIVAAPIKGLAMDAWYAVPGRPIGDLDLLLPEAQIPAAVRCLEAESYIRIDELDPEAARAKHSCALRRDDGAEVDLHWILDVRLEGRDGRAAAMERYWREARRSEWQQAEVLRLRAEHHFFHALVHGARVDSRAQARWAIDALVILRQESDAFDWNEIIASAREARLTCWLAAALDWIERLAPGSVPAGVRDDAARTSIGTAERWLWLMDSHQAPEGLARDLQRTLRWHLARHRRVGLVRGVLSYPSYLRAAGLLTGPRGLVLHLRRRRLERRARNLAERARRMT